ncbi:MAG: GNAT family N-acetyltransferase [Roseiflexaceae bacterium]|nr:GNAT family N-acetyltransferase [Roseiflexaceae bacterium]
MPLPFGKKSMQHLTPAIRPFTSGDLDALLPLIEALHTSDGDPFDPQRTRDALRTLLDHPEYGVVYVAAVDDDIVGYVVGSLGLSIEAGGRFLLIDELYVRPAWRGRGLARALLASLLPYARAHGCRAVELEVGWENDHARAWYERLGFERHRRFFCSTTLETLSQRLAEQRTEGAANERIGSTNGGGE